MLYYQQKPVLSAKGVQSWYLTLFATCRQVFASPTRDILQMARGKSQTMNEKIVEIFSLLLLIASRLTAPLLVRKFRIQQRKIKIQKRKIDALTIHVQVLTEYIERSRDWMARRDTEQNRPASKMKEAG